jgi:hypothetical protein
MSTSVTHIKLAEIETYQLVGPREQMTSSMRTLPLVESQNQSCPST